MVSYGYIKLEVDILKKIMVFLMALAMTTALVLGIPSPSYGDTLWFKTNDIKISKPSSGSRVGRHSTMVIRWRYGQPAIFQLLFSDDGGSSWKMIADDMVGTGEIQEYKWTTPARDSDNCKIRVAFAVSLPDGNNGIYYNDSQRFSIEGNPVFDPRTFKFEMPKVGPPTNLRATDITSTSVVLSWDDNNETKEGYIIDRKSGSSDYAKIDWVNADTTIVTDSGLQPDTVYWYRVKQSSGSSFELEVKTLPKTSNITKPPVNQIKPVTIQFVLNMPECYVNGIQTNLDQAPIIYAGRTLVPVRSIADALGVPITWDPAEKKVTIDGPKKIELWINNPYAKVNGVDTIIDLSDYNVKPIVMEPAGRTMLPLRFIAETLDCQVNWDNGQIMVRYPKTPDELREPQL